MAEEITPEEVVETPEVEDEPTSEEAIESNESEETEVSEEPVIPVRPTASYIIERKNRQIEKLRSQVKEEPKDPITERLDRIEELALGQVDDKELNDLFSRNPDARNYERQIKAYMKNDAYKAVPPEFIYNALSKDNVAKQVESKRKVADLEAKQTKTVGSSVRETRSKDQKTAEDIKNMTDAEFIEFQREQKRRSQS